MKTPVRTSAENKVFPMANRGLSNINTIYDNTPKVLATTFPTFENIEVSSQISAMGGMIGCFFLTLDMSGTSTAALRFRIRVIGSKGTDDLILDHTATVSPSTFSTNAFYEFPNDDQYTIQIQATRGAADAITVNNVRMLLQVFDFLDSQMEFTP